MKTIQFNDVTLRDGNQSLAATRMTTAMALRVLPHLADSGFRVLELWGGAILDACIRFTREDPWDRLEQFKRVTGDRVKVSALLRGQNLFGYQPYSDDLVVAFIREAVEAGVDVVRIFDALNDPRNLQVALLAARAYGAEVETALSYTVSPVHTNRYFIDYALQLEAEGADRIVIKDMAGILRPEKAVELFRGLKQAVKIPLTLHSHTTTGVALLNGILAMKYGLEAVDTAVTPFAGGSSLPPVEIMVAVAEELGLDHGLEIAALACAQDALRIVKTELQEFNPLLQKFYRQPVRVADVDRNTIRQILRLIDRQDSSSLAEALVLTRKLMDDLDYPTCDDRIFESQIPGGMLTNLQSQLQSMGAPHLLDQVMEEIPQVRADVGYVPLVTPTSQIVGSQAAFNILSGERYSFVSNEFKMILRGEFGRTPAEPNPEIMQKVLGSDEMPLKYRPASYLHPVLEDPCNLPFIRNQKDRLLHLLFGQPAEEFLKRRSSANN